MHWTEYAQNFINKHAKRHFDEWLLTKEGRWWRHRGGEQNPKKPQEYGYMYPSILERMARAISEGEKWKADSLMLKVHENYKILNRKGDDNDE